MRMCDSVQGTVQMLSWKAPWLISCFQRPTRQSSRPVRLPASGVHTGRTASKSSLHQELFVHSNNSRHLQLCPPLGVSVERFQTLMLNTHFHPLLWVAGSWGFKTKVSSLFGRRLYHHPQKLPALTATGRSPGSRIIASVAPSHFPSPPRLRNSDFAPAPQLQWRDRTGLTPASLFSAQGGTRSRI